MLAKVSQRKTLVIPNRNALRGYKTQAALEAAHGTQIITIKQLAARLAGGFLQPIDGDVFKEAVKDSIQQPLGELDIIKDLPGFQSAVAATLEKVWEAGLDLDDERQTLTDKTARSRIESIASLERGVMARLPKNQIRSKDLVAAALARVAKAGSIFSEIEIRGFTEMSPVWRRLLDAISKQTSVTWVAEARIFPDWLKETGIIVSQVDPANPRIRAVSCANPRHEILEALRWARKLLTEGVPAQDIAIATTSPATWDDYVLALQNSSELPLHFVHGISVLSTPQGQVCAALADILFHGFSHTRLIRFISLLRSQTRRFSALPGNWWQRSLPEEAPLLDATSWEHAISTMKSEDFPDEINHASELAEIVESLKKGLCQAADIGESLLEKRALSIWQTALSEGAAEALNETLASLRLDDGVEAGAAIIWAPASAVASFPRAYTWLVGLTSQSWPRRAREDPLLPNHIIPAERLTPLPVHLADRRDFDTLLKMTTHELVCSRARRESEGRLYGISSLYPREVTEERLAQSREAGYAVSPSDRLMARPAEFSKLPGALTALGAWKDWHRKRITAHDGLIRKDHPLLLKALNRNQSASSLVKLLRDPIAYLWHYGFRWKEPEYAEGVFTLDPAPFGTLVHEILEEAVTLLEKTKGGFGSADQEKIEKAIREAVGKIRLIWEENCPIPPPFIWNIKLEEAVEIALNALLFESEPLSGQQSWTEVPFGGGWNTKDLGPEILAQLPWNPKLQVIIPGTNIRIGGSIDRLDLDGKRSGARVTDYKTGSQKGNPGQLNGGAELQRCLYAFAVKTLLSEPLGIEAQLLYPRGEAKAYPLENPEETLTKLAEFLKAAVESFAAGNALPGPAAADSFNGLIFALPAGASQRYLPLKTPLVAKALAGIAPLWEET